jgi:RNA recognition motif-containing protein
MDSENWRVKRDPSELPAREQTPNRGLQRRNNGADKNGSYEHRRADGSSPFQGRSRDSIRQPFDDKQAEKAVEEGRRVYVGNLPYEATVKDIELLLVDFGEGVEAINMSVDPMTGRNPSYCFVDFSTKELAERAMVEYNGRDFLRRPLKVKPGVKSGSGGGRFNKSEDTRSPSKSDDRPGLDRWRRLETPEQLNKSVTEGRRLYVGGLPRFENNADTETQITDLFESHNFKVEVVSKLIWRNESKRYEEGNNNYCFVDLASASDTDAAISALNGLERWGWRLKLSRATGTSVKLGERRRVYVGGLPEFAGQEATEEGIRELFGSFEVKMVSKLFSPREPKSEEGNRCYCFVELANEEQTDAAIGELDWKEMWGWKVRVKPALGSEKQTPATSRGWRA